MPCLLFVESSSVLEQEELQPASSSAPEGMARAMSSPTGGQSPPYVSSIWTGVLRRPLGMWSSGTPESTDVKSGPSSAHKLLWVPGLSLFYSGP